MAGFSKDLDFSALEPFLAGLADFLFFVFAGKIPAFFVLIHLIDFAWISSLYLLYHKR
ncbi:hypothetical protein SMIDD26_01690 [Streptococcus mitis]|uniref:Uncharacterized protein n=1 Tax=Streptococcus mitis TaxID=28037 RepID=A0A139PMN9_STRMT|nr:hypothetical protein SMIDD26_01690 [Streptococcus mitis]